MHLTQHTRCSLRERNGYRGKYVGERNKYVEERDGFTDRYITNKQTDGKINKEIDC